MGRPQKTLSAMDERARRIAEEAWRITTTYRKQLARKYPRLDIEGEAAYLICAYAADFDERRSSLWSWARIKVANAVQRAARAERPAGYTDLSIEVPRTYGGSAISGLTVPDGPDASPCVASVAQIDETDRRLLELRHVKGWSWQVIARHESSRVVLVKRRIEAAAERLRSIAG